jgi:hypothetical protein
MRTAQPTRKFRALRQTGSASPVSVHLTFTSTTRALQPLSVRPISTPFQQPLREPLPLILLRRLLIARVLSHLLVMSPLVPSFPGVPHQFRVLHVILLVKRAYVISRLRFRQLYLQQCHVRILPSPQPQVSLSPRSTHSWLRRLTLLELLHSAAIQRLGPHLT